MFRALQSATAECRCAVVLSFLLCLGAVHGTCRAADKIVVNGALDARRVEVRCDLPPRLASAVTILEVVPEGKEVDADDVLIRLDPSPLEDARREQQIRVLAGEMELTKAQTAHKVSQLAREESEATYAVRKMSAEAEVVLSDRALKVARESFDCVKKRSAAAMAPANELAEKETVVVKAEMELDLAKIRLQVLEKFTKRKMVAQLEGAVTSSAQELDLAKARYELCRRRLQDVEEAIKRCVIRAPAGGRVLYSPETSTQAGRLGLTRPGRKVRAGQVLLRLYDRRTIRFRAVLPTDKAERLHEGMPATVRLGAFPDLTLKGRVKRVSSAARGKKTTRIEIEIADPPDRLRPGLTGQAAIAVEVDSATETKSNADKPKE